MNAICIERGVYMLCCVYIEMRYVCGGDVNRGRERDEKRDFFFTFWCVLFDVVFGDIMK